ncbi:MAG: MFS transporter [Thermodesulfobacteriota bacterium]|nr:MFS transporter [Thermodesulfobacteriota bacterium]
MTKDKRSLESYGMIQGDESSIKDQMLYSRSYITMSIANLFTVSSFSTFFLFPLFVIDHGGSKSDIGIIMGFFALSSVLCRPWISSMVDQIGRKRSYSIGCCFMSVLPLVYLLFRGDLSSFYIPLILIRILHGVGLAICFTATFTYIADITPEKRLNEGIGMFGITGLTGLAVGPIIAETIILHFGFSTFFLTAAGMGTIGFLLQLLLPETFRRVSHESSESFFSVLKKKKVLAVALLAFLFGFGLSASSNFVAPFAKEQNLSFISIYYIFYSAAAVFTRLFGGRLADRIGEARIIPYAVALTGGGLLILMFLGGSAVLVISGLLSGSGHGFLFPCLNALVIRNQPIHIRGKINGVFTGGIDAGAFIGSIVLGYIGQLVGFQVLFLCAGCTLLIGLTSFRFQVWQRDFQG